VTVNTDRNVFSRTRRPSSPASRTAPAPRCISSPEWVSAATGAPAPGGKGRGRPWRRGARSGPLSSSS